MSEGPSKVVKLDEPDGLLMVVGAQAGDRAALEAVLRSLQGPIYDHALFILRDVDAAEDVLQEVLIKVARTIKQLRDPRFVYAWAFRIAHRAALREQSRLRQSFPSRLVDPPGTTDAEEERLDPELVASLREAVSSLPTAAGAAIRLRYFEGMSLAEIAAILEIPLGTVKSRINYGVTFLRTKLRPR
jgi:RNA polymerase sigma-70 factor (ECF subfamily)